MSGHPEHARMGESTRVLIVDDDADDAESLAACLAANGLKVRAITEAAQVPAALDEMAPDILLLDQRLGMTTGTCDLDPQPLRLERLGLQAELRHAAGRALPGQLAAQRRDHRQQRGGILPRCTVGVRRHGRIVPDAAAPAQAATPRSRVSSWAAA